MFCSIPENLALISVRLRGAERLLGGIAAALTGLDGLAVGTVYQPILAADPK